MRGRTGTFLGILGWLVAGVFAQGDVRPAWATELQSAVDIERYCHDRFLPDQDELESGQASGLIIQGAVPGTSRQSFGFMPSLQRPTFQDGPIRLAPQPAPPDLSGERYPEADPNPVKVTAEDPISTFGADVDRTSYTVTRRYLESYQQWPPGDAVRAEEVVNALRYDYPTPESIEEGFRPDVKVFPSPWTEGGTMMRVGIRAATPPQESRPPAALVFLMDVSGSMAAREKLPLAKASICMLVHRLRPDDKVAMAVYAGAAGVALEPTAASERETILSALDRLSAGGSTAGGEGIQLAYALAETAFDVKENAIRRVFLATDGDFNVGIRDPRGLRDFVSRKRETGVFLTVLGFGGGNYNDALMQALAQNGNGVAAHIDRPYEARRIMVEDTLGTLFTVARDVKFQVEFNPARVAEYRLVGYETRALNRTDFNNDAVDSGDIGAGHTVTVLYELSMVGDGTRLSDPSRYGSDVDEGAGPSGEIAFLRIRYKPSGEDESRLIERPITENDIVQGIGVDGEDLSTAVAAAWFAEILRGSPTVPKDWDRLTGLVPGDDASSDETAELKRLIEAARAQDPALSSD